MASLLWEMFQWDGQWESSPVLQLCDMRRVLAKLHAASCIVCHGYSPSILAGSGTGTHTGLGACTSHGTSMTWIWGLARSRLLHGRQDVGMHSRPGQTRRQLHSSMPLEELL